MTTKSIAVFISSNGGEGRFVRCNSWDEAREFIYNFNLQNKDSGETASMWLDLI